MAVGHGLPAFPNLVKMHGRGQRHPIRVKMGHGRLLASISLPGMEGHVNKVVILQQLAVTKGVLCHKISPL